MCRVLAGYVTFNPDINRLIESIQSVIGQTDLVLIIDNGSSNIHFLREIAERSEVELVELRENKGIAYALRFIMRYAQKKQFDWVLTMDQDSVLMPDLVMTYKKYSGLKNIGAMTCVIKDRNYTVTERANLTEDYVDIDHCITSGCFMNVSAYLTTKGYDTRLFIDRVDDDICFSLRENGFHIICVNKGGGTARIRTRKNRELVWT